MDSLWTSWLPLGKHKKHKNVALKNNQIFQKNRRPKSDWLLMHSAIYSFFQVFQDDSEVPIMLRYPKLEKRIQVFFQLFQVVSMELKIVEVPTMLRVRTPNSGLRTLGAELVRWSGGVGWVRLVRRRRLSRRQSVWSEQGHFRGHRIVTECRTGIG